MKILAPFAALPALLALGWLLAPLDAQEPLPPVETKIILRISRPFLAELTGRKFQRDEPIATTASGATVRGTAHLDGQFNVKLHRNDSASAFDLLLAGEVRTQVTATRRPVVVSLQGRAPFHASRRIDFNGRHFVGQCIEADVCYHSDLDQICSLRGGLFGAVARRVARPVVLRNLPESDRQSGGEVRTQLTDAFRDESDKYLPVLNRVADVAHRGADLLREHKLLPPGDLPFQHAATDDFLLIGIGPHGQPLPALPTTPDPEEVPVELWIHRAKLKLDPVARKRLIERVKQHWHDIAPQVFERLSRRSPELAAILRDVSTEVVGPNEEWRVFRFAKGLHQPLAK